MVYVINKDGQPLMPTSRHGKVRRLLKSGKAKVLKRCPFTIQLLYDSTNHTQPVSLGIDAGSKHIGVSATTKEKVLYEADVELRNDIVDLLSTRRQNRRARRNRKTRYREPWFNNRKRPDGWLAPSIQYKVDTHLKVVENVHKILPITSITVTMYPSSQLCSGCGYKNPLVKNLTVRTWECPVCHTVHGRDVNAGINILNKGLQMQSA